jgi:hypothetical protein
VVELLLLGGELGLAGLKLLVSSCDCLRRPSVRIVAAIVLSTMPTDSISWSRKLWWVSLNSLNEASSITAFTSSSNKGGRMLRFAGAGSASPEPMRMKSPGTFCRGSPLVGRAWPTGLRAAEFALQFFPRLGAVAGRQFELGLLLLALGDLEDAVLRVHQRRRVRHDEFETVARSRSPCSIARSGRGWS